MSRGAMLEEIVGLIVISGALLLLSGVCVSMTRRAAQGSIGRNAAVGIRTRHTQASDEAWVAGHEAALSLLTTLWPISIIRIVAAVLVHVLAGSSAGILTAVAALLVHAAVLVRSAAAAKRSARAVAPS